MGNFKKTRFWKLPEAKPQTENIFFPKIKVQRKRVLPVHARGRIPTLGSHTPLPPLDRRPRRLHPPRAEAHSLAPGHVLCPVPVCERVFDRLPRSLLGPRTWGQLLVVWSLLSEFRPILRHHPSIHSIGGLCARHCAGCADREVNSFSVYGGPSGEHEFHATQTQESGFMAITRLYSILWVGEGSLEVDSMEQEALFLLTPDPG